MERSLKVVIIEDEPPAAARLEKMLLKARPNLQVVKHLDSVIEGVTYFKDAPDLDLCFMDIQLADGISFEILSQVEIKAPIIFTTAYDDYALQAFKVNSLDYLLKPIDQIDLEKSLDQFDLYEGHHGKIDESVLSELLISLQKKNYKERFLIKSGQQLSIIPIAEIAYFVSDGGYVQLTTKKGGKHLIEYSLDNLSDMLDPNHFYRINRKFILAIDAIQKISSYFNSRLKLQLNPSVKEDVIVSRERVGDFKRWLDR